MILGECVEFKYMYLNLNNSFAISATEYNNFCFKTKILWWLLNFKYSISQSFI